MKIQANIIALALTFAFVTGLIAQDSKSDSGSKPQTKPKAEKVKPQEGQKKSQDSKSQKDKQEKQSTEEKKSKESEAKKVAKSKKQEETAEESSTGSENKKTGNWYIRQSPQLLKAFEPITLSARKSTVKVLGNIKSKNAEKEGQIALGTVIDGNGYILTKASEIFSRAKSLKIEVNGKKVPAKVFGIHENSDLALLKVEPAGLEIEPIEWNPQTPEVGYFLATPNSEGKPLGIGVLSVGSRRNLRGFMGVNLINLDDKKGSRVTNVVAKSPAQKSGVLVDDVITHVNGKEVKDTQDLISKVQQYLPGQSVKVKLTRKEKTMNLEITLGSSLTLGPRRRLNPQETIAGNKLSKRREGFERVIQHDTVLAPEQMGSPVLGLNGQALGLNIAKNGRVSTFALPISVLEPAIAALMSGKLNPAKVHKPRIEELTAMIAEKEKAMKEAGLRKAAEEAERKAKEAADAFEEAKKAYEKQLRELEDSLSKKLKADDKQKKLHLERRDVKGKLRDAEKEIEKLQSEKEALEDTFK